MASVTIKILSLFVRTLSKPVANRIKRQARSHEGFRKICISGAQTLHRIDMRLRLGLLQDPEVLERQIAREAERVRKKEIAKEAETIRKEQESEAKNEDEPTSKDENTGKDKEKDKEEKDRQEKARLEEAAERVAKSENSRISRQIKPLSEAKAIELGTNFLGEAFVFGVALVVLLATELRGRRKEGKRREDVAERLDGLESERDELRKRVEHVEMELKSERERNASKVSSTANGHEGEVRDEAKGHGQDKAKKVKTKSKEEHHKTSSNEKSKATAKPLKE